MGECLAETEGKHRYLHGTATHAGGHLAAEHGGGGTGQEQFDPFGIEESARERFPARDDLDLVKEERGQGPVPLAWKEPEVFLDQERQARRIHAGQSVVLEIEGNQGFPGAACGKPIAQTLPEVARLPAPAHADHGESLAGHSGEPDLAPGQGRY